MLGDSVDAVICHHPCSVGIGFGSPYAGFAACPIAGCMVHGIRQADKHWIRVWATKDGSLRLLDTRIRYDRFRFSPSPCRGKLDLQKDYRLVDSLLSRGLANNLLPTYRQPNRERYPESDIFTLPLHLVSEHLPSLLPHRDIAHAHAYDTHGGERSNVCSIGEGQGPGRGREPAFHRGGRGGGC